MKETTNLIPCATTDEMSTQVCSEKKTLNIVLVVDTVGNQGNGTSNSALQYAKELERQGHRVRIVGVGAPQYSAQINRVPLVSWVAGKQQMQFARPDDALFRKAFQGADIVHIYMPFKFGRRARRIAEEMGIAVTAGFHLQPENVTYSAGPLRCIPGVSSMLYSLFRDWLYGTIQHIHVPSRMIEHQLLAHGYRAQLHVISNGYSPNFHPNYDMNEQRSDKTAVLPSMAVSPSTAALPSTAISPENPFRIAACGRLTHEKDYRTLITAISLSKYCNSISLRICGTGPLKKTLERQAQSVLGDRTLRNQVTIGFESYARMPELLRSFDLFVHTSRVDIESLSVLEACASGLVPVIASSELSAAQQFAMCDESVFPAGDAQALAELIDWWIEHPAARLAWSNRYAKQAVDRYGIEHCVALFVDMLRVAIVDNSTHTKEHTGGHHHSLLFHSKL